ncbi:MAG: radical SAM protein [Clostridia bacterium]|nr:radical SAM protein [Clostridia bacterium]
MAKVRESSEPFIVQYLHQRAAQNKIPLDVTLELTARCNFSCRMCYVHNKDCNRLQPEELTAAQWLSIAGQAKAAGAMFLLLTGGEPFVRADFCEIYEALAQMGFVVSLNTNLSLLSDAHLALFDRYPPNRINVSLYGTRSEIYADLCGVPAFETVAANIERLQANGIPVKVNSSITPQNADDLENIMRFCDAHALVFKGTAYMFPSARLGTTGDRLPAAQVAALRAETDRHQLSAEEYADRTQRILAGVAYERDRDCPEHLECDGIRCRAGSTSAWIDWRGNMSFCGMVPASADNNVLSRGFDACWEETKRQAAAVRMPLQCKKCEYQHLCNLCAASQLCETGGFDAPPPYICEISAHVPAAFQKYSEETEKEHAHEEQL